jgi:uncharacterized protein (DUF1810 family)
MADPYDLDRFVSAQNSGGIYEEAMDELRRGRKTSHWMWFVFPQIAGLGQSPISRRYAITSVPEAKAYLQHPVIGPRLRDCAATVAGIQGRTAGQVFGGIDAQKLRSSMTLFSRAAPEEPVFQAVLDRFFDGVPDAATDRLIGRE